MPICSSTRLIRLRKHAEKSIVKDMTAAHVEVGVIARTLSSLDTGTNTDSLSAIPDRGLPSQ